MQRLTRSEVRIGATALILTITTAVGLVATTETRPTNPSTETGSNHINPTIHTTGEQQP